MVIPGYRIDTQIGQGGMATVYLATQESLDRKVALKVLSGSLSASDPSYCERFVKEGKIIAQLSHPHIITIYDIGCFDSHYYMSMEYAGAPNLKQRIQSRQLGEAQSIAVVRQMAKALSYAHACNFVHRDVKPANILFRVDGSAVLSDFGIAKALNAHTQLTAIGWAVGTPEYMSPEQAWGRDIDLRSDLYSLGIVFYEMLTGEKPFVGKDLLSTALMHIKNPVPVLPEPLIRYQPIIERLLAKTPAERYGSADELLEALDGLAPPRPARAPPARTPASTVTMRATRSSPTARRKTWRWVGAISVTGIVSAGFLLAPSFMPSQRPAATATATLPAVAPPKPAHAQLSLEQQAKVARLLEIAEAHLVVGRLTDPPGSNAYDAYRMVLEIDPDNNKAQTAVRQIEAQAGLSGTTTR